jgi:hypothetical protein
MKKKSKFDYFTEIWLQKSQKNIYLKVPYSENNTV